MSTIATYGQRPLSGKVLERAEKLRELLRNNELVTREMMREAFGRKFFWSALAVVKEDKDMNVVAVRDGRKILGWKAEPANKDEYQVLETVDFSEARKRVSETPVETPVSEPSDIVAAAMSALDMAKTALHTADTAMQVILEHAVPPRTLGSQPTQTMSSHIPF